jgi:hypothetical protein
MERLNNYRMKVVLVGIGVAIVLGGGSAYADFTFSTPIELGLPIWSPAHDPHGSCFSRDGLELYFASDRPGGLGGFDIWVATRETIDALWGEPVNLGPNVNSPAREIAPAISPNGLELYFTFYGDYNIRVCSRPSKDAPWSNPELLGPPIGVHQDEYPEVSADGLSLYFESTRPGGLGGWDIWVSTRATTSDPWSEPINLGPNVNSGSGDGDPSISSDGLALFFISNRPGGSGTWDLWVTTRPTTDAEWGPPVNYTSLNSSGEDFHPAISPDGSVLYFESPYAMWQSSITPIVDFNGDEIVDIQDLLKLIESWGKDDPSVDIGPMPWGDGIVDVNDLEVLMSYWQQEILPPELAAYWKLDEAEGSIAQNGVTDNDGMLHGEPLWQPEGGKVGGALQFSGAGDFVSTDFVLNPEDGPLSAFAWMKGGAPGEVIISQTDGNYGTGATWLGINATDGNLMTGLVPPPVGRFITQPMLSETVIIGDQWHHVGFVWDDAYRSLYVDGVEVAKDATAQNQLKSATGGLYIGVGKNLEAGTFFSGLIDDVRIYNIALNAERIAALAQ